MAVRNVAFWLALVGAVAGCGGTSSSLNETDQVFRAWHTYSSALSSGNVAVACTAMTPGLAQRLRAAVARYPQSRPLRSLSCTQLFEFVFRYLGANPTFRDVLAALGHSTVTKVRIHGNSASFAVSTSINGTPLSVPRQAQKVGGAWRISCCLGPGPSS